MPLTRVFAFSHHLVFVENRFSKPGSASAIRYDADILKPNLLGRRGGKILCQGIEMIAILYTMQAQVPVLLPGYG